MRPVHLISNYWKRTGKAGRDTGLLSYICTGMTFTEFETKGRRCLFYADEQPEVLLVEPLYERELEALDEELLEDSLYGGLTGGAGFLAIAAVTEILAALGLGGGYALGAAGHLLKCN